VAGIAGCWLKDERLEKIQMTASKLEARNKGVFMGLLFRERI
jgi:hypothetical protein